MRAHAEKHKRAQTTLHHHHHMPRITHYGAHAHTLHARARLPYPIHPTVCAAICFLGLDTSPLVTVSHPAIKLWVRTQKISSLHRTVKYYEMASFFFFLTQSKSTHENRKVRFKILKTQYISINKKMNYWKHCINSCRTCKESAYSIGIFSSVTDQTYVSSHNRWSILSKIYFDYVF